MKTMYVVFVTLLIGGLIFFLVSCNTKKADKDKKIEANEDSLSPKVYHTETNAFNDLRAMAFSTTPDQLQLSLSPDKTVAYAIIMDWGIDTAIATIVSYQTGDASMYLSSGGGIIGGGQHQSVSNAAKAFVSFAQNFLAKAIKTVTNPLPQQDEVKFYFLTNKGVFVGQDVIKNFENNTSPWLSLFEEGNKVLTELRMISKE